MSGAGLTLLAGRGYCLQVTAKSVAGIRPLNHRAHKRSLDGAFFVSARFMAGRMGHLRVAALCGGRSNPVRPATLCRLDPAGGSSQTDTEDTAMTNLPAHLKFEGTDLSIIDHNGTPWLSAADIARAMDYKRTDSISRIYDRNKDEFTDDMTVTVNLTVSGKNNNLQNATRIFSPRGCHLIAMFSKTAKAKAFRHWVLDVLDGLNDTKAVKPSQTRPLIRCRDDLAFTARDGEGHMVNWRVPHDCNGNWHDGLAVGRAHFDEVATLACVDERGAFNAVRFALSGAEAFERGASSEFQNQGWGIEGGFAD